MFFPPEPSLYCFSRFDKDGNPIDDDDDDQTIDKEQTKKAKTGKKDYNLASTDDGEDAVNTSKDSAASLDIDVRNGPTGKKTQQQEPQPHHQQHQRQ